MRPGGVRNTADFLELHEETIDAANTGRATSQVSERTVQVPPGEPGIGGRAHRRQRQRRVDRKGIRGRGRAHIARRIHRAHLERVVATAQVLCPPSARIGDSHDWHTAPWAQSHAASTVAPQVRRQVTSETAPWLQSHAASGPDPLECTVTCSCDGHAIRRPQSHAGCTHNAWRRGFYCTPEAVRRPDRIEYHSVRLPWISVIQGVCRIHTVKTAGKLQLDHPDVDTSSAALLCSSRLPEPFACGSPAMVACSITATGATVSPEVDVVLMGDVGDADSRLPRVFL